VLDSRLYRVAFAPLVLAIIIAAFALSDRPRGIGTTLAPDAFDGRAAMGTLTELARTFPNRRPGSAGDEALARRVEREIEGAGFRTERLSIRADAVDGDADLTTIVGERTGRNNRRLLIVAQRDAAESEDVARLSATAALIQLARLFEGRPVRRTMTLASVSGGTGGMAGVRDLADRLDGPTDAVLVLGDLASERLRTPVVIPWSEHGGMAPLRLRRTVEAAVREEAGVDPGSPRALAQLFRLAVPLTLTPQGPLGADGLSAVTIQASAERGPEPGADVSADRFEGFGRATLRSISALDNGPEVPGGPREYLIFQRRVLPQWAVAMLAGLLLLPAVIASVDGLARVRRRRRPVAAWLRWLVAGTVPFLLAALVARLTGLSGLVPSLDGAVDPGAVPASWAAIALVVLALGGGFYLWPRAAHALGVRRGDPSDGGAAAAVGILLSAVAIVILAVNPYTALLLVPTVHLWLLAAVPEVRLRRLPGVALVVAGLAPFVLVALYYAEQFALGPLEVPWGAMLLLAGGTVGPLGVVVWSLVLACGVGAAIVAWNKQPPPREEPAEPPPVTTRGPLSYAGPGSLGGTESALR
jgi:hypothetical protein